MRLHNIVVKDIFGHLYRLHLPHEAPIHRRVEPKDLRDKVSARCTPTLPSAKVAWPMMLQEN